VRNKQVRRRRAVLGVLVAASLILLTAYFGASPSSPLHQVQRGIVEVLSPVQEGASKVLSPVRDVANWFSSTLKAKSLVNRLEKQNGQLQYQVSVLQEDELQNKQYRAELKLDSTLSDLSDYTKLAANVYSRDPELFNQTIYVDKGSDDGVHIGDPVIGDGGLVGDVTTVAPSVSVVTEITDPSFEAAAEVEDSNGDQGTIVPETGNPNQMLLEYLPANAQISQNQVVETAGFKDGKLNDLYPAGIPIGTVSNADQNTLINDQQVQVTPFVDLRHITTVQILIGPGSGGEDRAQVQTQTTAQVPGSTGGNGSG
jgi:rod shape-determining protein MreC